MPKMKTHKGTAKRVRLTKNGKLLRMKQGRSHLRRNKRRVSDLRKKVSTDSGALKETVKQVVNKPTK